MEARRRRSPESLSLDKALNLMRKGSRLMLMHTALSSGQNRTDLRQFYLVPGGHLKPAVAQAILNRPDVFVFDDGLFPGHPQSWKIGG